MKMNSISGLTLIVKDLAKSTAFYEALGFRLGKQEEGRLICYVNWFSMELIADDQATTPAHQQEAQAANRGAGLYVQIKVENADEFYEGVLAKGMTPDGEPQGKKTTGRSFILRDLDGYKLVFFEKK